MADKIKEFKGAVTDALTKVVSKEGVANNEIAGPYAAILGAIENPNVKLGSGGSLDSLLDKAINYSGIDSSTVKEFTSSLQDLASATNTSPSGEFQEIDDIVDAVVSGEGQSGTVPSSVEDAMYLSDTYLDDDITPDFGDNEAALQSALDALHKIVKSKGDTFETEHEFSSALGYLSEYYEGATTFVKPEIFAVLMSTLNRLNCMVFKSSSYVVYAFGNRLLCLNLFDSTIIVS